eukprot:CAMPEP_0171066526 /NCGR_PEP_ID=MMETSP0766_2-20121228/7473_1 /TAXON_ID=439317 /ORGANISM="Gambierdiscus australes, Strain CAWD 149" /LENGTH=69 /DNA_ID=CAMNT_0011522707 /DNA_START=48 /DNA_END=253 /DNA_ORIENTATION=+
MPRSSYIASCPPKTKRNRRSCNTTSMITHPMHWFIKAAVPPSLYSTEHSGFLSFVPRARTLMLKAPKAA